jgi:glycosyltransferase involved in cell wall biosynthesis
MPGVSSPEQPLRILHIFRTPVGGLFRHVMDIARGQITRGHAVGIVCDSTTGGARAEAAMRDIAPRLALGLTRIPMSRNPGPSDIAALKAVRKLVRETRPDIVHGHGSKGGLFARLPAFFDAGWPVRIYTPHGGSFHFATNTPRDLLYRTVERVLAKRTSLFLMESAYIAARAEQDIGPIRAPVRVIRNGITDAEFEPVVPNADAADILYLGEMRVLKGVDTLLLALAALNAENQRLTALLVGAGPDEAAIQAQASALGLSGQVTFAPPRPIREALAEARLMVMPSRGESLPYVVLEAAAAAMPLIATNVGGIPEIFGPQKDRLIPPSDPAVLAAAIKTARAGHAREDAAALAAYVHANFSYNGMVDGGLAAYRAALAGATD